MTQALQLEQVSWSPSGPDLLMTAYLPQSGALTSVAASATARALGSASPPQDGSTSGSAGQGQCIEFYKAWDEYGCFSNFSAHPIQMPSPGGGPLQEWLSVEHYYQSQKFQGVEDPEAVALIAAIATAPSPEEAAAIGRRAERERPDLVHPDWEADKPGVMLGALRAKFMEHAGPRRLLLSTSGPLAESSPHDYYWGRGYDGSGNNMLGRLLVEVREEMVAREQGGRVVAAVC
jgi:diaminohydroxyphosphoribosylaminopyrimidine deaminase/5-amino-6-(5-phosphoribosylamino)uracil reductase